MIVVDTSAVIAILLDEPEKMSFERAIASQENIAMSAVNAYESTIVFRMRHGSGAVDGLWRLLKTHAVQVLPFDEAQMRVASEAFQRFGKGLHSKARLNLCDCAAYALARTLEAPLLFKGDDFTHTDIMPAL